MSDEEYYWRLHCLYGSMMYVRAHNGRVDLLVSSEPANAPAAVVLDQLTTFIAAGLNAPSRVNT